MQTKETRRLKKWNLLSLALIMTMLLAACSSGNGKAVNTPAPEQSGDPVQQDEKAELLKKEVKLTMYLIGDMPAGQEMVVEELNKLTKRDINATIEVKNIPWGDWQTKYNLIFNTGEKFDIAFATAWADYYSIASKGGFREITDEELGAYLPLTKADLAQESRKSLWEQVKVEGKAYLIPQTYEWQNPYALLVRGDLREKYGLPEIKTTADYYNYAATIGDKEKGIVAINTSGTDDKIRYPFFYDHYYGNMGSLFSLVVDNSQGDGKVMNLLETPELLEWAESMRNIYRDGGFPKSVLSGKTNQSDSFKAGTGATVLDGINGIIPIYLETLNTHPEWKPEIFDISSEWQLNPPNATDGGLAVSATSENPERAMMFIDLLRNDRTYNELFHLGIQGVHWEPVGDKKYKQLEEGQKNYAAYTNAPWGLNTDLMRVDESTPDFVLEWRERWADQVKPQLLDGFTFDDSSVKNEIAAIKNVETPVVQGLNFGVTDNPQKIIDDMNKKLKAIGLEKVQDELQKQINAFLGK